MRKKKEIGSATAGLQFLEHYVQKSLKIDLALTLIKYPCNWKTASMGSIYLGQENDAKIRTWNYLFYTSVADFYNFMYVNLQQRARFIHRNIYCP